MTPSDNSQIIYLLLRGDVGAEQIRANSWLTQRHKFLHSRFPPFSGTLDRTHGCDVTALPSRTDAQRYDMVHTSFSISRIIARVNHPDKRRITRRVENEKKRRKGKRDCVLLTNHKFF